VSVHIVLPINLETQKLLGLNPGCLHITGSDSVHNESKNIFEESAAIQHSL